MICCSVLSRSTSTRVALCSELVRRPARCSDNHLPAHTTLLAPSVRRLLLCFNGVGSKQGSPKSAASIKEQDTYKAQTITVPVRNARRGQARELVEIEGLQEGKGKGPLLRHRPVTRVNLIVMQVPQFQSPQAFPFPALLGTDLASRSPPISTEHSILLVIRLISDLPDFSLVCWCGWSGFPSDCHIEVAPN
jgi:hypothetical protein